MLTLVFIISIHSRIVLNEVMANPRGNESGAGMPGDRNEFLEIYNNSDETIDLSDWRLTDFDATDDIIAWSDPKILARYPEVIINSTLLPAHSYGVILDPEYTSDDTTGGYVEPYPIPKNTLILTVGNTTLGDGLASTDPVLLYSPTSAESTSFGTPFDAQDSLPADAGDGISWERIRPDLEDSANNWVSCLSSSGSTPGYENSTTTYHDLAISSNDISFTPDQAKTETPVTITAVVHNRSFITISNWQLRIYNDVNHDSLFEPVEQLANIPGGIVTGRGEKSCKWTWARPEPGTHILGVVISSPQDEDSTNNVAFAQLNIYGTSEYLKIVNSPFNPEKDTCEIDFYLPEPDGYLVIAVYDMAGRTVKTLVKKKVSFIEGKTYWDGRSEANRTMPVGVYIVNFEYRLGEKTFQARKPLVLAKPL